MNKIRPPLWKVCPELGEETAQARGPLISQPTTSGGRAGRQGPAAPTAAPHGSPASVQTQNVGLPRRLHRASRPLLGL